MIDILTLNLIPQTEVRSEKARMMTEEHPYVIVQFDGDFADELSLYGIAVMLKSEWQKHIDNAACLFEIWGDKGWQTFIGSNQDVHFDNYKDWFDCFTVTEVDTTFALRLKSILGTWGETKGHFPSPIYFYGDESCEEHIRNYGKDIIIDTLDEETDAEEMDAMQEASERHCEDYLANLKNRKTVERGTYEQYRMLIEYKSLTEGFEDLTPCEEKLLNEYKRILGLDNEN